MIQVDSKALELIQILWDGGLGCRVRRPFHPSAASLGALPPCGDRRHEAKLYRLF